jgi:Clp amino terminal domain, pathogenicity island component/Antitoxin FitA-like, ribbon-helix-helix
MATLHVRSVPDPLYELLRERAAANGRSIGAEVVNVLELEFGPGATSPWRGVLSRRRAAPTPFHHFAPRGRQVVADAREEARELSDPAIGTEHLLLAILREPPTVASFLLENTGLKHAGVRAAVEEAPRDRSAVRVDVGIPFTPGAKKALELALRYCIDLHSTQIGPEHLLLGIAREEEGLGARILARAGQDANTLREALSVPQSLPAYALTPEPAAGFRVVELTGEAEDWEEQLNQLASRGYVLVELVGSRAIFSAPR